MAIMGHKMPPPQSSQAPPAELDAASAVSVAQTMQALAAASRLMILSRLRREPCSVSLLAAEIGMEQSAVSHQLRVLRHLGLVASTRNGKTTVYALYDDHVARLLDEAVYHSEHLRLGLHEPAAQPDAVAVTNLLYGTDHGDSPSATDRAAGFESEDGGVAVPVSRVEVEAAIAESHREEWARVVASLTRRFGDLDIAEEAAAEAFAAAVERWPADGVPPNPGGWLTTTANRKAIDRIRRESKRDGKQREARLLHDDDPPEPPGAIDDERLRLIFTCCHPALAMETRVALTLRMVGGLTVPEIARAFLVGETAMGQRITRAKAKIKAAGIPYRVPSAADLPERVSGVLAVLFLVFNEGYLATGPGTDPVRCDLTAEAIRLTRLIRGLMPGDGEVAGLLALMVLTDARRPARVSASGELVTLSEQDRGAWDATLIAEGHQLVRERLAAGEAPGRYQILAAINAVHTSARDVRDTDWSQVLALYDQLARLDPSPVVALNRAIVVAELDGPEVALAAVDRLEDKLAGYHAYHAARADLLRRLGRGQESRAAYGQAIEQAGNSAETAYLTRRRDELG
jgi:RNA polymerase sigma-70 factor (ECF subfamily)